MSGADFCNTNRIRLRKKIQRERWIFGVVGLVVLLVALSFIFLRDTEQYLAYTGLVPDGVIEGIPGDPLKLPVTVAVGIGNEIYIGDQGTGSVIAFDEEGRYLLSFGGAGSGLAEVPQPVSLAVAPNGNLYVADAGKGAVVQFARDGSYLGRVDKDGKQALKPTTVAADSQGNLFVLDKESKSIKILDSQMRVTKSLGQEVVASSSDIQGMKLDEERRLLTLVDAGENKLYNLDLEGNLKETLELPSEIKKLKDAVYNPLANQYFIVDQERNCVVVTDVKGMYLGEFGNGSGALGNMKNPMGITRKIDGSTYIADSGNSRVVIYRKSK